MSSWERNLSRTIKQKDKGTVMSSFNKFLRCCSWMGGVFFGPPSFDLLLEKRYWAEWAFDLAEHTCSYLLNLLIQQIHIRNYFKKWGRSDLARRIFSASVAAEWKMLLAVIRINVTSFSLSQLIKISLASLILLELFLMQSLVFLFKIHVSCKNS